MRPTAANPGSTVLPAETMGDVDFERLIDEAEPYKVIIYNDDVNTFAHVIRSLMEVFGHSPAVAERIALDAHESGKAVAGVRPREEAERCVHRLHERKIQATMEPV